MNQTSFLYSLIAIQNNQNIIIVIYSILLIFFTFVLKFQIVYFLISLIIHLVFVVMFNYQLILTIH